MKSKKKDVYELSNGKKVEAAQVILSFNCPFCIIATPDRLTSVCRNQYDEPFLVHPVPECKEFRELEADEYMKRVRLKLGNKLV